MLFFEIIPDLKNTLPANVTKYDKQNGSVAIKWG